MQPLKLQEMLTAQQIEARVSELGAKITEDFRGQDVVAISVLKGSFVFFADLVRAIDLDICCEFMGVASYHGQAQSSGEVKTTLDLTVPLEGKNVLLVEDIVDTGLTMNFLKQNMMSRKPKRLVTATLLFKPAALKTECQIDHIGFAIENQFVVGYGLDFRGCYRNLPYIAQAENLN